MNKRRVFLDVETTGLNATRDRIIEIAAVELIDRKMGREFHSYINPGSTRIDSEVVAIHGITNEFLEDMPLFKDISKGLLGFLKNDEIIAHNASFDVSFINAELQRIGLLPLINRITDTVRLAKQTISPPLRGKGSYKLDNLCRYYGIDTSKRTLHGAKIDVSLLSQVYLRLVDNSPPANHQANFGFDDTVIKPQKQFVAKSLDKRKIHVIKPTEDELAKHEAILKEIEEESNGECVWISHNRF